MELKDKINKAHQHSTLVHPTKLIPMKCLLNQCTNGLGVVAHVMPGRRR